MKYRVILFFTVLSLNVFSQNNNVYNLLYYKLSGYLYSHQNDSCKIILNKIQQSNYSVYPRHLKVFVKSALIADDTIMTEKYLNDLISKTELDTSGFFDNVDYSKIKGYFWWNNFVEDYDSLRLYYYQNFDFKYSIELQQMLSLDKYSRTRFPDSLLKYYCPAEDIDKKNYKKLMQLYAKKGFPCYSSVGYKALKANYLLLMHSTTYEKQFFYIDSVLTRQLDLNNFEPWMYANIIDRYYRNIKGYQIYGSFIEKDKFRNNVSGNIIDIKDLDTRRYSIGLNSFRSFAKDVNIGKLPLGYVEEDIFEFIFNTSK